MNSQDNAILSMMALGVSVITAVIGFINHKRIRSRCCGKTADLSLDIENTTPPSIKPLPNPV